MGLLLAFNACSWLSNATAPERVTTLSSFWAARIHWRIRYTWLVVFRGLVGLAIGGIVIPFDNLAELLSVISVLCCSSVLFPISNER